MDSDPSDLGETLEMSAGMMTCIDGVYVLRQRIGQGGMAAVYLAQVDLNRFDYTTLYAYTQVHGHSHLERRRKAETLAMTLKGKTLDLATIRTVLEAQQIPMPAAEVAVKVALNCSDLGRFEGEWKNLLCLNHPNVIQVYGGGVYERRPYYAMELLRGLISPKDIRERFTIAQKLDIIHQGAEGLQYLHDQGIVHRDIKPDNLPTCEFHPDQFRTKVSDLGLGKNLAEDLGLTQSQSIMGSPAYMSPEQIASTRDVDHRADIYSLGASLYELTTGFRPYHDKTTVFAIISAVSRGEPPLPVKEHAPQLPDAICGIIDCAMARNPEERYQRASDLAADLATYLALEAPEVTSSTDFTKVPTKLMRAHSGDSYIFPTIEAKSRASQRQSVAAISLHNSSVKPHRRRKIFVALSIVSVCLLAAVAAFFGVPKKSPPTRMSNDPVMTATSAVMIKQTPPQEHAVTQIVPPSASATESVITIPVTATLAPVIAQPEPQSSTTSLVSPVSTAVVIPKTEPISSTTPVVVPTQVPQTASQSVLVPPLPSVKETEQIPMSSTSPPILTNVAVAATTPVIVSVPSPSSSAAIVITPEPVPEVKIPLIPGEFKPAWASAFGKDEIGSWADLTVGSVVQRLRLIPAGTFLMGSSITETERNRDEIQHSVTITKPFWMADTACTQELWLTIVGTNPSKFQSPPDLSRPVELVSWDDCQNFLNLLNTKSGGTLFRLPTEAEWEYACRAGTTTPFSFGESIRTDQVNFDGTYPYGATTKGLYRERTLPVKTFATNPWGLYDMHGNVWQWCNDWYGEYPAGAVTDPAGPITGSRRVRRGGAWRTDAANCRSARRFGGLPTERFALVGFRIAIQATP